MTGGGADPFAVLVGLKLSIVNRIGAAHVFHFGEIRAGPKGPAGAYALRVQCAWRLAGAGGVVTGFRDLWQYGGPGRRPDDWSYEHGFSLQDRIFDAFIGSHDASTLSWFNERDQLTVTDVLLTGEGDVRLWMSEGGYELFVFPEGSREAGEAWRFFAPGSRRHLVFPGRRAP